MTDYIFPQNIADWQTLGLFFLTLGVVLALAEGLKKYLHLSDEFSRKFVHVAVGMLVLIYASNLDTPHVIVFASLCFTLINFIVLKFNLLPAMATGRISYGTVLYPLTIAISAAYFWYQDKNIFYISVWVLAIADALAAGVGQSVKRPVVLKVWYDSKSVQGALAMFGASALIIYFTYFINGGLTSSLPLYIVAIVAGVFIMLAELISIKGSDNFSVVLAAAFILSALSQGSETGQMQFVWATLFGFIFVAAIVAARLLTPEGGVATWLMAIVIFGVGGWNWTLPLLVFFFSSSALSYLKHGYKKQFKEQFEKSSRRDGHQVFANGGIALLVAFIYYLSPQPYLYFLYLSSLAAANADTWATELGVLSPRSPRLIATMERVEKGRSGAVSITGLTASMAGSLAVVVTAFLYLPLHNMFFFFLAAFISGFFSSLADSILGATLQAQFRSPSGRLTEKDPQGVLPLVSGWRGMNNDWVNFISISLATLFCWLLISVLM